MYVLIYFYLSHKLIVSKNCDIGQNYKHYINKYKLI
jgi:hypothetical protein